MKEWFCLEFLPAGVGQLFLCDLDERQCGFLHKRPKAHSKFTGETGHLFRQRGAQVFDLLQIVKHGCRQVHQIVKVHRIVFGVLNFDLESHLTTCGQSDKLNYFPLRSQKPLQFVKLNCTYRVAASVPFSAARSVCCFQYSFRGGDLAGQGLLKQGTLTDLWHILSQAKLPGCHIVHWRRASLWNSEKLHPNSYAVLTEDGRIKASYKILWFFCCYRLTQPE